MSHEHTDALQLPLRTWSDRTFSPLAKDSLRAAILMMLVTSLGTGIFTLHQVFSSLSIGISIILTAYFAWVFYLVSDILIISYLKKREATSLSDLVKKTLGSAISKLYDICFLLYIMFTLMAMMLTVTKNVYKDYGSAIGRWFGNENVSLETFNFYFVYLLGFTIFWLVRLRSIDAFRYFSLFSFGVVLYIVLLAFFQTYMYYNNLKPEEKEFNLYSTTVYDFFSKFGLLCFAYNCVTNFFSVSSAVRSPTEKRLQKVFFRVFFTLMGLFIVVGISSYLSLGKKARDLDLFIYRPPLGTDYMMSIGLFLQIFSLGIGIGINSFPLKILFFEMLGIELTETKNNLFSAIFTLFLAVVVSFFYKIDDYINLCGSFFVTVLVFIIPGMMGFSIEYYKHKIGKLYLMFQTVFFTIMGVVGGILAILKFFNKD